MSIEMNPESNLRIYDAETSAVFRKTDGAFGGLSNMASGYPIRLNGIYIRTSEALYQACRFPHMPEVQKLIISESSPMTAKMKSKPFRKESRSDWDHIRVRIMKWCLRVKLSQNWTSFGNLLLTTDDMPIVEESLRDEFWGAKPQSDGTLIGKNVLGRLLMELRSQFAHTPSEVRYITSAGVDNFLLFGEQIATGPEAGSIEDEPVKQQVLFG